MTLKELEEQRAMIDKKIREEKARLRKEAAVYHKYFRDDFGDMSIETVKHILYQYQLQHPDEYARILSGDPVETAETYQSDNSYTCEKCGAPLTDNVVEFCRTHSYKFDGKLLCRNCQSVFSL